MFKTPLFANHLTLNASMEIHEDWMLADHFGDVEGEVSAAATGAVLFDLANHPVVTLTSDDARRWCNGMFSNQVKRLRPGQGNLHAMCDDRGRVQGLLDLYCIRDDHFLLVLDGVTVAAFEERYRMFLLLDDIELESEDDLPTLLSVQGPTAEDILRSLGMPIPDAAGDHAEVPSESGGPGLRVIRRSRFGMTGFDLLVPPPVAAATWQALSALGARPAGFSAQERLRLRSGTPRWPVDGDGRTLVHELGIQAERCNFSKGCYVGQEVINRVDVKGQVTRRLTGLRLADDAQPPHGAEVWLEDKKIGFVTTSVRASGEVLAFGILRRAAWEPGVRVEVRAGGRAVAAETATLPFA